MSETRGLTFAPWTAKQVAALNDWQRRDDATVGQRCVVSRLQGIEIAGQVLLPEAAILATYEHSMHAVEALRLRRGD